MKKIIVQFLLLTSVFAAQRTTFLELFTALW